jgi:small-conductance mechanosensitive channel
MTEKKKVSIPLLYGAIAGGVMILFTLGTWWGGPETFVGPAGYWKYALLAVIAALAGLAAKRQNGGFLGFRPALRACFGTMVIGMAVQTLFAWLLLTIDTGFKQRLMPVVIAQTEATYRHLKFPEEDIAKMVAEVKAGDPFSFGSMLVGLARIYIVLFLVALLMAAIIGQKKSAPGGPSQS